MASTKVSAPSLPAQENTASFEKFWRDLGITVQTPRTIERDIIEDEPEASDRTDWEDFISYHAGVRL
ncbi:MAG TPA: hypothetical protein VNK23_12150 [Candidatus Dormibacteraeota bacterium]|nr:hypothetical protein [Candidatus Dormibacteraeota bacterium]